MKDQFVTYEIAKKLKELGFNHGCLAYYLGCQDLCIPYTDIIYDPILPSDLLDHNIAAPLWQQAIDWLRIQYGWLFIPHRGLSGKYTFHVEMEMTHKVVLGRVHVGKHNFYYQAYEAAILKALELIAK